MGSCPWPATPAGSGPQVEAAGGCPAPGIPAHQQQQRLAVLAAVEWLPTVIRSPMWSGRQLVGRAAIDYDRMAAAGGAAGVGACGATPCPPGVGKLLVRDLAAVSHVGQMLRMACKAGGMGQGGDAVQALAEEAAAAVREVLPAALDMLEVLALVHPQGVLDGMRINQEARLAPVAGLRRVEAAWEMGGRGPTLEVQGPTQLQQDKEDARPGGGGPGLPWDERVREAIVEQGWGELVGLVS